VADVALLASQAGEAPIGYQVPGAQEIILKSITASFDGTGASGDFVPVLQIVAPNGAVLASCPVATQVAAGGSADVSWFPRGGVATSGGGGITLITSSDNTIAVSNPGGPTVDLGVALPVLQQFEKVKGGAGASIASLSSGYLPWVHGSGTALLSYTNPLHPTIVTTGEYQFTVMVGPFGYVTPATLTWRAYLVLNAGLGSEEAVAEVGNQVFYDGSALAAPLWVTLPFARKINAGTSVSVSVHQDSPSVAVTFAVASDGGTSLTGATVARVS